MLLLTFVMHIFKYRIICFKYVILILGGINMTTGLYKKGLVLGIICLFIGAGGAERNETI